MNDTNCPNCNAILSYDGGLHCDYCGAVFERPHEKRRDFDTCETVTFYSDDSVYCTIKVPSPEEDEGMERRFGYWRCSECGCENFGGAKHCVNCGKVVKR